MTDQIMTVKEVATYLKVNDRTIYRMAMSGKIPAFRVGASWRFKFCEIEAWIESEHASMQQPISDFHVLT
jgi:excisionase family DNA binding protein